MWCIEGGPGDNSGRRVQVMLKLMERFLTKSEKKRVAVVDPGSDQAVNKKGRGGCGERKGRRRLML